MVWSLYRSLWQLVLPLIVLLVAGCAGGSAPQTVTPPPTEVGELNFELAATGGGTFSTEVSEVLQTSLLNAGYRLVQAGQAPDVTLKPSVTSAEEPSFFQVTVNGQRQVKYRVHVTLTVTIGSQMVDQLNAQFVTSPEKGREANLSGMVSALSSSPRLERAAHGLLEQRRSAERARKDAVENEARMAEETAWARAAVAECRMPSKLTACDAVRLYVAKYERGAHAQEAAGALKEAEPALLALQRDENQWKNARAEACRNRPSTDECTAVEIYLTKLPAGLHAEEARRLLAAVPREH